MCDCFHIAFPNWHAASSGPGAGRRLRGPEPGTEDNSICDEASQFTEGERPRPQGSSPVEEFPESDKYDSDKECEAEHDPYRKSGKKAKKSGLGSIFDKRSTPKMSKLKAPSSPEAGVIVKTAKDGGAEGLVYSGGGKDGIFIKEVVPESPASKNLHLKEGDQVLSATVYFDNIPYEDAIQILEHAQAYKVKLCLKRKPEISETEGAIDSDAIPEDEVHQPEMREPGKKRRGDARISWPKFPTLGRGKKSRFTRSHSSSEADEQRKLELSPTTSDTESPIKTQDALKGKKKHKIKLPGLKRGRISSSEDTDAQNIQTEEMISPECLESPSRETQDAEEELKKDDDVKVEESETETHKTELVCLDSTLKTADITEALVEQETPSATASPDGKKKKKERSELKLKILGRDKKHKAKSSPKRLKTLGASLDKTDDKENEKTEAVPSGATENIMDAEVPKMTSSKSGQLELRLPKVEIDISDVGIICKSNDKKGKGTEEKQAKTGFKLPKVGLTDIATEDIIKIDMSVEGSKTKDKNDAYDRLSKGTELPKREDIEIPGMEDASKITKDFKEPRAPLATISDAELQAETVQLSIDVDSVKEAVSKLPGYKLPKVDMSGVPIPDEITVIDANAQRISVKTPTKGKHESKSVFTEMSKTIKLPAVKVDVSGGEMESETKLGVKKLELDSKDVVSTKAIISQTIEVEKVQKESITFSSESVETSKNFDIKIKTPKVTMPDLSISKPDIKMPDLKMDLTKKKDDKVHVERTIFLPGDKIDVKVPDVKTSPIKAEFEIPSKETDVKLKLESEEVKVPSVKGEVSVGGVEIKMPEKQEKGEKFKMPTVGITVPKVKGGKASGVDTGGTVDVSLPDVAVDKPKLEYKSPQIETDKEAKFGIKLKSPEVSLTKKDIDVTLPEGKIEVDVTKPAGDLEAQGGKFKLPKLGLKMPKMKGPEMDVSVSNDVDVNLPDVKAKVELPEIPAVDAAVGEVKLSIPEQKVDVKAPSIEVDIEGGKFKMPKLGVKMPKVKGPEIDISLSKKDMALPTADEPKIDVSSPEKKIEVKTEGEVDGRGGKFKMPKLGITMPKMKGPEIDLNLSKKDVETTLPEVKADIKVPDLKLKDSSAKVDISTPEIGDVKLKAEAEIDYVDPSLSVNVGEADAKAGKFKMPKFGISMPKVKGPEIDFNLSKEHKEPADIKAEVKVPKVDITVGKVDVPKAKIEIEKTGVEIKPFEAKLDIKKPEVKSPEENAEVEGQSSKFKIPRFTVSIPKVKGPEIDLSLQKKEIDVALPEAKIEVEQPKAPKVDVEVRSPEMDVDIEGQGGKFKLPKFGIKMPKVKGPEIDVSLPKKDVKSPEIKADIKVPEVPKVDVSLESKADVKIYEAKIEVEKPTVDVKPPSGKIKIKAPKIDVSVTEDSPSKFKMPSLGFSVPKVKAPEADLSKKDIDVTLPDAKVEVDFPDISGKADVKAPEVEVSTKGSPLKFKMPTFKLPKFGGSIEEKDSEIKIEGGDLTVSVPQADIDLPKVSTEVTLPEAEVKAPSGEVLIEQPSGLEIDAKFKKPRFSMPRFSFSKQSVPAPEVDISAPEVDIPQPEGKVEVKGEIDVKSPELDVQIDGQGSKFKLPKFGISMPKMSAPEIDLSLSKKDVEVTLPEAKVEGKLPDVEVKSPSIEAEIKAPEIKVETKTKEGSPSKLKMPTFKFPKFGVSIPEADVTISGPQLDVELPDVKAEIHVPEVEVKAPSAEVEIEQPSGLEMDAKFKKPRFSLPRFSFSKQSVPAPEVDISAPEVDIPQPEGKVEVKGDIDVKSPEVDVQIDGQGGKFKLPKFGISMPKMSAPEIDLSLSKKDVEVTLPEAKVEGKLPDIDVKAPSIEAEIKAPEIKVETKSKEGSPSKLKMPTFKFPKFGASIPEAEIKVDGIDISKVDVDQPDVKAEINLPEVKVKAPSVEVDGQGGKFKLPKFGISMPKMSAPEVDLSLSKKDVEVTLPEAKVEGKLPDVEVKAPSIEAEIKAPEIKVETKTKEGSPSKLKMPTFKFPKFGVSIPEADATVSEPQLDVELPDVKAEIHVPEAEVKAPSVEVEIEQPSGLEMDAKFKKPRFSLPRFSFSKQSVPAPEVDISAPEVDIPQPEGKVEVKGDIDVKSPEVDVQIDGHGSKFKLPKFGISMPKMSAPEIDLSLSKKDVEVTLPEAKAEGKLPDVDVKAPSIEAEIKAPEIKIETKTKEGSPSKLKMPTFKLPKFGASIPETEIKVDGTDVGQVHVDLPEVKAEVHLPEVEVKAPSVEVEIEQPTGLEMDAKFKKPRFSLPRFSFSKQSVPVPEVDISAPEVDIPQPEGKVEVKGDIDVKSPEVDVQIDGQGSKFKLPKFGISMPKMSAPEVDLSLSKKDAEVTLPEAKVKATVPDTEVKAPSIEVAVSAPDIKVETKTKEGSPSKLKMPTFKLPKFGVSIPEAEIHVDGPDVATELPQVDTDLPEVKAEVQLPEVEVKAPSGEVVIEQPSGLEIDAKFKKPRFSMPRFSFSKQSVPAPEVDISAPGVNISQPEGKVEMKGEMDVKAPELDVQTDGQGGKFKLPKFGISMPKMSAPEIDLSLSKKDGEVTLPEAKLETKVPDVEMKVPSIEAEIKAPEIKVETKTKEGSPSKLKMPTFKFPKFGASIPETEIKVDGADVAADIPDVKLEISLPETEVKIPSGEVVIEQPSGLEMDAKLKKSRFTLPRFSFSKQSVAAPEVDISVPEVNIPVEENVEVKAEIDVKSPEVEAQVDGQGSRFKFPKFGISMPKMSGPEVDLSLSKKDVDVTLPETKVEGKLPGVELKGTSVKGEIKGPEIQVESKHTDDSPSKLKMPSFRMPKFGLTTSVSADGADIKTDIPEEVLTVQTDSSSVDIKVSEPEVKRSKFKLPSLGFSTSGTDVSLEKKDMQLPDVEIKESPAKVDIKVSGMDESNVEVSPSKFKMPTFKLPKFGATAQIDGEVPDVDTGIKVDVNVSKKDVESEKPEAKEESKASWSLPRISFSKPSVAASEIEAKHEVQSPEGKKSITVTVEGEPTSEIDLKIKKPRFSLPKISFAKQPSIESEADASLPEVEVSSPAVTVEVKQSDVDQKIEGEVDAQGSKFKMPKFGISMPKVKGPEIDVSISKKEAKADVPETKAPLKVEESPTKFKMPTLKLPKLGLSVEASDAEKDGPGAETTAKTTTDVESKKEHTGSKFSFGISMPKVKGPETDLSLSKKDTGITSPDAKVETTLPETEDVSLDAKQKGASWSFPKFSFSKPAVNVTDEADFSVEPDLTTEAAPELEVKAPSVSAEDSPAAEPEIKAKFSLPKFSFSKSSSKEPIVPENAVALEVSLAEGEVKIKEPKDVTVEVNSPENDAKSKEIGGGSPLKFKMPVFKMPKIGITTTVNDESSSISKDTEETIKMTKEGGTVVITAGSPSIEVKSEGMEFKTDVTKASTPDPEAPQAETQGSPSKFKLPSFKMPRLSFSKAAPEDENTPVDSKIDEDQLEKDSKEESKSPKKSLTSIGEILKNIDVEFDVTNPENVEAQKEQEVIKMETKQEATKSPERTGWFKFPTFGLSSPTERVKEDKKSPDLTGNEELSPTCSIQSSEAFADISSTMTSETTGFSLSSPTKVTVKYSDPDTAALMGESHSNVVMSTTKTEVVSVEPNLPEKVTILSSGQSSSSEDTVKLESGKIHIISSNIQATPGSQQAKMLTSIHVQSAEGVSGLGSWTVTDSRSSQSSFMESRVVRESSSKEVVITKQITRVVKTTEPISDETATSIKQLKDSVHTDKMRFFDEAEK
ncbi:neuroblast differentiation-associated protein AHNAK-like [Boleophthalmus pectinirostris]|uniref:neuroblast differentiation-associated protein AHNAK-like n=1 Tax=Boleophthalmus pectinirostris TaxID=150288 RepID=UPI00242B10E8|nr:neuroblast differentiation-associated protein AHNAK-like [Boleophthalmus pectinirostris]